VDSDILFVPETLPLIARLREFDAPRADALLALFAQIEKGSNALLAQAANLPKEQAAALLRTRLEAKPSARVLARWLTLRPCGDNDALGDLSFMFDALKQASGSPLTHRCAQCGFGTLQQHWQCPSCKNWGTTKPLVQL
jgi:lipopolysaccharide assembly protein B